MANQHPGAQFHHLPVQEGKAAEKRRVPPGFDNSFHPSRAWTDK